MKRFLRDLLIVNVIVGAGFSYGAWKADWSASQLATWLGLACIGAFFLGFAALGGTGPTVAYTSPDLSGGVGLGDIITAGAEAEGAYRKSGGDFYTRWKARHGWNSGSHHLAMVMLATGVTTAVATSIIWGLF